MEESAVHRVALISDTHVSPKHGFFVGNVVATIEAIEAEKPDLVVHCGDLTINGADDERDLRFAAFLHGGIKAPLAIIPGNHDIGEEACAAEVEQEISPERIARYRSVFGPDRWARDLGGWRLIGLNSLLIGSGLADERIQLDWLAQELNRARERPVGVFLHKPLWTEHIGEPSSWATVDPAQRRTYLSLFVENRVRFVASGHVHQALKRRAHGLLQVWAPSCAFPLNDKLSGEPVLGYAVLELSKDGAVEARFVTPPGLTPHDYLEIRGSYGSLKDCPPHPSPVAWEG